MDKYYFLSGKFKTGTAIAYTEGKVPLAHELLAELKEKEELPFDLFLRSVKSDKKGLLVNTDLSNLNTLWQDYQPNCLAWPLMSEKLKHLIEQNLTGNEKITWLKVAVKSISENRVYYIPKFEVKLDVLNEDKTLYVQGTKHVIKPVFSLDKIKKYHLFNKPQDFWEITSGLYISNTIKELIQKNNITGVDFENITVD